MARGEDTRAHPGRSVTRDRFPVGQPQRWSASGSNVPPTNLVSYVNRRSGSGFTVTDKGEGEYSRNIAVSEGRPAGPVRGGRERRYREPYNWESRGQS